MTTRLNKSVVRETGETHDGRPIIVALVREGISLREKGRRTAYIIPYRHVFTVAARLHADAVVAERRRRKGRGR